MTPESAAALAIRAKSTPHLISEKAQQAHLVSLWAGKMVAPTQEVRHEDEPSAISTRAVDA
jgi:hypothetical protein